MQGVCNRPVGIYKAGSVTLTPPYLSIHEYIHPPLECIYGMVLTLTRWQPSLFHSSMTLQVSQYLSVFVEPQFIKIKIIVMCST